MRVSNFLLISIMSSVMLFSSSVFAETTKSSHAPVVFQVIQDQINFDKTMIKSASVITKNGKNSLEIVLNPSASKELAQVTGNAIGKTANFVINGKIMTSATIRASLQNKFLISDISKEDGQTIVDSLNQ